MKPRRLFGIVLALAAVVFIIYVVRLDKKQFKDYQIVAERAAGDVRSVLRSEADSAFAHYEPLRIHPPLGSDLFLNYLKDAVARGEIMGGFVELPTQALMDPSDTAFYAAEMMGPMALSTPPNIKIPPGSMTEDFLKTMESTADQMRPVDSYFHLHLDGPPPSDWGIRAYLSPYNNKVHLLGLAFVARTSLRPDLERMLNDRFYGAGGSNLTLQLINAAGQTAYIAGELSGKRLVHRQVLVPADMGYSGWQVNIYAPTVSKLYLIFSIVAGIVGVVVAVMR